MKPPRHVERRADPDFTSGGGGGGGSGGSAASPRPAESPETDASAAEDFVAEIEEILARHQTDADKRLAVASEEAKAAARSTTLRRKRRATSKIVEPRTNTEMSPRRARYERRLAFTLHTVNDLISAADRAASDNDFGRAADLIERIVIKPAPGTVSEAPGLSTPFGGTESAGGAPDDAALNSPRDGDTSSAGSGGPNMSEMTREEIDAKIAASEARGETGLERVLREIDAGRAETREALALLNQRLGHVEAYTTGLKGTVVVTGITIFFGVASLLLAILAYGGQWFGLGLDTSQVAEQAAERALKQYSQSTPPPTASESAPAPKR